ncbi:PREDICTED: glucose-repressible alcohol dehydrogenase transcriptional effector-like [Priapulus caudatus]|uniref:Glucose-repressible alcohol dehydrogenase transcriptional effector-like n=1 Tax=Priapulus caudatus TaxID=37621 RepID=A0ABM1F9W1_PRICU|nr:PREDICTED: glucose-repressible alcohol dehydrogenase transcriptional effector-like [Priapulus caudatus]
MIEDSPLSSRQLLYSQHSHTINTAHSFTVTSYNVLAEHALYHDIHMYEQTPVNLRPMNARHPLILAELLLHNSDIICLQEVSQEYYTTQLLPDLQRQGYAGVFHRRADDLGQPICYKQQRFELVQEETHAVRELARDKLYETGVLREDDDVDAEESIMRKLQHPCLLVLAKLRCKLTGRLLTVANVHTLWGELGFPEIQVVQIALSFRKMVEYAGGADATYICCGDFNSTPFLPGYYLVKHGGLNDHMLNICSAPDSTTARNAEASKIMDIFAGAICHSAKVKSAYETVLGQEPRITNWALMDWPLSPELGIFEECLDYIWYSHGNLRSCAVLQMPEREDIARHSCIPSVIFPSDHISIQAVMQFVGLLYY